MRIDDLLTKDSATLKEFVFSLPAFALMGKYEVFMSTFIDNPVNNWSFGQHFKLTANTHCTHLQNPLASS